MYNNYYNFAINFIFGEIHTNILHSIVNMFYPNNNFNRNLHQFITMKSYYDKECLIQNMIR